MNIFAMFPDNRSGFPNPENARCLDDLRLNKMIVESVQLLSTVLSPMEDDRLYKPTHANHPCTIWARESLGNAAWLVRYTRSLLTERSARGFTKVHKSGIVLDYCQELLVQLSVGSKDVLGVVFSHSDFTEMTPFVNCTTNHKHIADVHEAYRAEMCLKWSTDKRAPKWTNQTTPSFYTA